MTTSYDGLLMSPVSDQQFPVSHMRYWTQPSKAPVI